MFSFLKTSIFLCAFVSSAKSAATAAVVVNENSRFGLEFRPVVKATPLDAFINPVTGHIKNYWVLDIPMSWEDAQIECRKLAYEPVAVESDPEMIHLAFQPNLRFGYYWTSGRQSLSYNWEVSGKRGPGIPASPRWCGFPAAPVCIALHSFEFLHAFACTEYLRPICQSEQ